MTDIDGLLWRSAEIRAMTSQPCPHCGLPPSGDEASEAWNRHSHKRTMLAQLLIEARAYCPAKPIDGYAPSLRERIDAALSSH